MSTDRRAARAGGLIAAGAVAWLVWRSARRPADLAGRVVAITGGSRGLGLLLARELGAHGCRIAICARDARELRVAADELAAAGVEVMATECDVSDAAAVHAWIAAVRERLGPVDVLVNNAGIIQVGPIEAMTTEDFERAMAIVFMGGVHTTLAVLPEMRARGEGRIVNITSIGGKVSIPHLLPYGAAKFAMVGFSEGLRSELAKDGIRVTTVVPGLMRTGSPPQATFKGRKSREFTWFSLGSATPLTAMSARRAARQIVEALRRGEAEVTLTWQAKLLQTAHALAPGVTSDALGLVNRLLPSHDGSTDSALGMELATPLSPSPITALMNRSAVENNEYVGAARPSPEHAAQAGLSDRNGTPP